MKELDYSLLLVRERVKLRNIQNVKIEKIFYYIAVREVQVVTHQTSKIVNTHAAAVSS
jgi:hypothetical protein